MFGKWFASTYTGSMLGAGANVFAVWSWIVANAGPKGVLEINPALLAAMIGEPVDSIEAALAFLQAPDGKSRSGEEEGRRLVHEEAFTYRVVNHAHYRAARSEEERREYKRDKQREYRAKVSTVDNVDRGGPKQKAEAEDREQKSEAETLTSEPESGLAESAPLPEFVPDAYEAASYLFAAIRSHKPDFCSPRKKESTKAYNARIEKKLTGWTQHMHGLIDRDGKPLDEVKRVIDYCHRSRDTFNRSTVQSGSKLCKRWEELSTKASVAKPDQSIDEFDFVGTRERLDAALGVNR